MRQQRKKLAQAARLQAAGQIDNSDQTEDDDDFDNALAAFGLQADQDQPDTPPEVYYIWPENVRLWQVWQRCQTLWRVGMQGREGLDYAGLWTYLHEVERIKPRKSKEVWACMLAMERAALEAWAKLREQNK